MRQYFSEFARLDVRFTPHDSRWVPKSARFVVLGETAKSTGVLSAFKLSGSGVRKLVEIERQSGFKCCTFGSHTLPERLLVAGTLNGELESWDLEQPSTPLTVVRAHESTVNAVDGAGGGVHGVGPLEIVTGGRDGTVKVWDSRQENSVATFRPRSASCECWSVAFGNAFDESERCVLAGYENGDIKMYDLRHGTIRFETNVANGVCDVEFDRKDISMNKFIAACLESQFVIFDARTQHNTEGFASTTQKTKISTTLWGVRHLPQDRELFTALLGDGSVELYRYEYPSKRVSTHADGSPRGLGGKAKHMGSAQLSTQPVNSWDWHAERRGLGVCTSFDQVVHVVIASTC